VVINRQLTRLFFSFLFSLFLIPSFFFVSLTLVPVSGEETQNVNKETNNIEVGKKRQTKNMKITTVEIEKSRLCRREGIEENNKQRKKIKHKMQQSETYV